MLEPALRPALWVTIVQKEQKRNTATHALLAITTTKPERFQSTLASHAE